MTPQDFRVRLAALNLSQVGAARALNIDPRTVRKYISGDLAVTRMLQLALDGLALERSESQP